MYSQPWQKEIQVCVIVLLEERLVNDAVTEVVVDVCGEKTSVPVICDVTSIVNPGDEIPQCIPGNLLILIQVQPQQVLTNLQ